MVNMVGEVSDVKPEVRMERRNALGFIFEGMDESLLKRLRPDIYDSDSSTSTERSEESFHHRYPHDFYDRALDHVDIHSQRLLKLHPMHRSFSCTECTDPQFECSQQVLNHRRNATADIFSDIDGAEKENLKRVHLQTSRSIECY